MSEQLHMYNAVSVGALRTIMARGEVPGHLTELDPATLRASVFLAATALAREAVPPSTPLTVMEGAMPIIMEAIDAQNELPPQ